MAGKKTREVLTTLTFDQAVKFCVACLKSQRTPYLEGQPGIGKSAVAVAVQKEMKLDGVVVVTPTMHNALDLRGFGYTAEVFDKDGNLIEGVKETRFAQSQVLPSTGKWLIFVDELPDCPIHEQSGFYQLFLSGMIGEYKIPEGSFVMGAGNRPQDQAAANPLSTALRGRIATAQMHPTEESILKHAFDAEWHPLVISFIKTLPDCIWGFDPRCPRAGCTPRDLDAISRLEKLGWPSDPEVGAAIAEGNLGSKYGEKYFGHRTIVIPDPMVVFTAPMKAEIPKDRPTMYAYLAAIAQRVSWKGKTDQNLKKIIKFADRLEDPVLGNALMIDCLHVDKKNVVHTDTFKAWHKDNAKYLSA